VGRRRRKVITLDQASYIPAGKLPAIGAAVLAACDAQGGVADGILDDPRQCHFDPATLLCKGADSNSCLTRPLCPFPQVAKYKGAGDTNDAANFVCVNAR
jgi:feruloyl esterase